MNIRDYKKFFTYPELAKFMADLLDPQPFHVYLEPSAGNGALVKAVKDKCYQSHVFAFEIDPQWLPDLKRLTPIAVTKDFLTMPVHALFNGCIANPPFGNETNLQDHFDHIKRHVKIGGKIVMIVPDDFDPKCEHKKYPLENWSINSDGSKTEIKIIVLTNW